MSLKHFLALAETIRRHNSNTGSLVNSERFTQAQIEALADFCAAQNPLFKKERWLQFCAGAVGPRGGKR